MFPTCQLVQSSSSWFFDYGWAWYICVWLKPIVPNHQINDKLMHGLLPYLQFLSLYCCVDTGGPHDTCKALSGNKFGLSRIVIRDMDK